MLDGDNTPNLQVDREEGQSVEPDATATSAAPVRRRRSIFEDRTVRAMGIGAFALVILYLALVIGAFMSGLMGQNRPIQTAAERDLRLYESFITQGSKSEDVWSRYANALIRTQQYGKAQDTIDRAKRAKIVDPRRQLLAVSQVNLLMARKEWKQAIRAADAGMLALRGQYGLDWAAYRKGGQPTVMTATGLGESYYTLLYDKAKALEQLKQPKDAIKLLDEYLKEKNTDADALEWRGDLYAAAGDKKKALADYKAASTFMQDTSAIDQKIKGLGAAK